MGLDDIGHLTLEYLLKQVVNIAVVVIKSVAVDAAGLDDILDSYLVERFLFEQLNESVGYHFFSIFLHDLPPFLFFFCPPFGRLNAPVGNTTVFTLFVL